MSEKLYSENYKRFIRGVSKSEYSIQAIADYTKKSMHLIASDMHIGRLEAIVNAKPNVIDRVGFDGNELLFQSKEGYSPVLYTMNFTTESGVSIIMNAYPEKDYEWNDEEKDDLEFICSNFFQLFERARLIGIFRRAAITDGMTGAYNITGFIQLGSRYQAEGTLTEYSTLFVNIKNLKLINRNMGNQQGDSVLRGFVERLNAYLLPDELIARLGGDNFVILVKTERVPMVIEFMGPLTLTVNHEGQQKPVDLFFRIGICQINGDIDIGKSITYASTALTEARREGTADIIWFDEALQRREMEAKQTSFLFGRALTNHEFKVYYQPKVRLSDNTLCGSEALVRWLRDGRIISPMAFIPALEHDGSICELDFYVFEHVCRDIRMWLDEGIEPVTVSVNFSKYHIKNDDFATKLLSILDRYNIAPEYIEVELTESACYEDYGKLKIFLAAMREKGVKVSIDDFGTGYSSLSLLKDLMVNVIKLDQSFVKGIDMDGGDQKSLNNDMVVIRNIVKMVDELDMDIIAEGVETLEEAGFLKNVNCDMAQGFLFDKPMPRDDFELLLRGDRRYNR